MPWNDLFSYIILGASIVLATIALWFGRDRFAVSVGLYFVMYQVMEWFISSVQQERFFVYAAFAVGIDLVFFYAFKRAGSLVATSAVAVSMVYGAIAALLVKCGTMAGYYLGMAYNPISIALSLAILFDGVNRALSYRYIADNGRTWFSGLLGFRAFETTKAPQ